VSGLQKESANDFQWVRVCSCQLAIQATQAPVRNSLNARSNDFRKDGTIKQAICGS
jgi:hypothetical protein